MSTFWKEADCKLNCYLKIGCWLLYYRDNYIVYMNFQL